jgi:hypothetical protein
MEAVIKPDYNDNMRRIVWAAPIMTLIITLCCVGCHHFNDQLGLASDNALEQSVEAVIKVNTGLDIDLTPGD